MPSYTKALLFNHLLGNRACTADIVEKEKETNGICAFLFGFALDAFKKLMAFVV